MLSRRWSRRAAIAFGTVEPEEAERLQEAWASDAAFMKQQPGFISTQLHRGIGGSSVCLQQVTPLHPNSLGSIRQGMPLLKTYTMPSSVTLAGTLGLPSFGLGGAGGKSGSKIFHSSSLTSSFLIPARLTPAPKTFGGALS